MLLKLFAILALLYFFFRSIGHVLKAVLGGGASRTQQRTTRTRDGLHVDSRPNQQKQKKDFKGGDYVDYEEVE